jgi:hypothetical protein
MHDPADIGVGICRPFERRVGTVDNDHNYRVHAAYRVRVPRGHVQYDNVRIQCPGQRPYLRVINGFANN